MIERLDLQFSIVWMAAVITAFAVSFLGLSHGLLLGFIATMLSFGVFWTSHCYFLGLCNCELAALRVIFCSQAVIGFCYLALGSFYTTFFDPNSFLQLVACFLGYIPGLLFSTAIIYFALGLFIEFCRQIVR